MFYGHDHISILFLNEETEMNPVKRFGFSLSSVAVLPLRACTNTILHLNTCYITLLFHILTHHMLISVNCEF